MARVVAESVGLVLVSDAMKEQLGHLLLDLYADVDKEDTLSGIEARIGIASVQRASQSGDALGAAREMRDGMRYVREVVERSRRIRNIGEVLDDRTPLDRDLDKEGL